MNVSLARTSVIAALLVLAPAGIARADDATAAAAPTASTSLEAAAAVPSLLATSDASLLPAAPAAPSLELTHLTVPDEQVLGVHYRPRGSSRYGRGPYSESATQIHAGFFDPEGAPNREFLLGARGGPMLSPNVQLGVGLDWSHIYQNTSSVQQATPGPNNTTLTVSRQLASASTNLFPVMAFVQVSGDDNNSLVPYIGASGGYEVLNLSADDYQTGNSFNATYGGWGWQVWAGAALPLSGQVRLGAEAFLNQAQPGRDVDVDGGTYRETVNANGAGLRVGLAWGF